MSVGLVVMCIAVNHETIHKNKNGSGGSKLPQAVCRFIPKWEERNKEQTMSMWVVVSSATAEEPVWWVAMQQHSALRLGWVVMQQHSARRLGWVALNKLVKCIGRCLTAKAVEKIRAAKVSQVYN